MDFQYGLSRDTADQIGLIVLQSDETIERDMRLLMPANVELLVSRVPSGSHVTPESLAAMEGELAKAASLFPQSARFCAIGYGCTSGTAQIGSDRVADAIIDGTPGSMTRNVVTNPVSALTAACHVLGVRNLGLLSPYIASVSKQLCSTLSTSGIAVTALGSFNESEEGKVARIDEASLIDASASLAKQSTIDALFLSCTNLRTLGVIEAIERHAKVPVLTSNQVLAWHMLRLANITVTPGPFGQVWSRAV